MSVRPHLSIVRARTLLIAVTFMWVVAGDSAAAVEFMFRGEVNGEQIEGQPLTWTATDMQLLGRDGRLYEFNPQDVKNAKKTGTKFVGYSMQDMKRELYREFGDNLEISNTKHYIVAHPRGQQDAWSGRFEELYRWCLHYFRVRGFTPREPAYPLVAIVYRNQGDYFRAASESGTPKQPGALGHYDPETNRVYLFDVTAGNQTGDWSENADTIIHEATHQTAFNVGIHRRFADTPRWLAEGLATMFEARGVWNSQSFHSLKDRLNEGRLRYFQSRVASGRRKSGTMAQLIASDRLFRTDSYGAYAEAWALTLYLCETRPRQYVDYLAKTASQPVFGTYSDAERVADFAESFGGDFKQLEANFLAWMAEIK